MNIELKRELISVPKTVAEPACVQNIDLEINLPDYCTDIKRVLRCFVVPSVGSVSVTGDRMSAKGDVLIRLVYVGEGEKIDCYEQSVDLSAFCDAKDLGDNPIVCATAKTRFVNCRAASQRRFVVGASISVVFTSYKAEKNEICVGGAHDCLETKESSVEAVTECVVGEKLFDVAETVSLPQEKSSVARLIGCNGFVKNCSVKAVSGKVLLKGDLEVVVTYCADTKERPVEKISHTMPISQIIEIPGIDEKSELETKIELCALAGAAKSDSSGSDKMIEIASKLSCLVIGTKKSKTNYITDCYFTKCKCKAEYRKFDYLLPAGKIEKMKKVSCEIDLAPQTVKKTLCTFLLSSSCGVSSGEGQTLSGKGSVCCAILFVDEKDKIQYTEKNVDFDFSADASQKCEKLLCNPSLCVANLESAANGGKLTVSFDANVSASIYCVKSARILQSVATDEKSENYAPASALTVYYCSKGESVWNIAKKYNTRKKSIMEENRLSSDTIDEDKMLIIPCV